MPVSRLNATLAILALICIVSLGYVTASVPESRGVAIQNVVVLVPSYGSTSTATPLYPFNTTSVTVKFLVSPEIGANFYAYYIEIRPGGGTIAAIKDKDNQWFFYVLSRLQPGAKEGLALTLEGATYKLSPGDYAYIPAGKTFTLKNIATTAFSVFAVKKPYIPTGYGSPSAVVDYEQGLTPRKASRSLTIRDMSGVGKAEYDMITLTIEADIGGGSGVYETHIEQHGVFYLSGTAEYLVHNKRYTVTEGDFLWIGPWVLHYLDQKGSIPVKYVLYKG